MNTSSSILNCPIGNELSRMIEPLASYICAAEQPKAVLNLVYAALVNEVAFVNRTARSQAASFARTVGKIVP